MQNILEWVTMDVIIRTRMVFMCSFLCGEDFPTHWQYAHLMTYHTLFGVGIMLKGGGTCD